MGGQVVATASAPVWQPSIQSAGVAEWTAICGMAQLRQRPTIIYTVYAALVRAWEAPPRFPAAAAATRHGGLARFDAHPHRHLVPAIGKTKAHVDARAVADNDTRRVHAIGNSAADAAAKAAALRHPPWECFQQRELALAIERITVTLRVAANLLPLWRAASTFKFQRPGARGELSHSPRATVAAPLAPTSGNGCPLRPPGSASPDSPSPSEAAPSSPAGTARVRVPTAPFAPSSA